MDPINDAALERDVERALAVDPSPEFVARVRTRIAEEPSQATKRFGWLFTGVATAAVAASVVALVMFRPDQRVEPATRLLTSRALTSSVVVPAIGRVGADLRVRPGGPSSVGPTHGSAPTMTAADATTPEPPTLFDPRETMALQRLIAAVHDARVDLAPLLKEAPMPLQSLDNLIISPITIEPLVPGGSEGERP
jgi:hypothetical protein